MQQRALKRLLRGGSLRWHAEQARSEAYLDGASLAAAETGLRPERFPTECPWTLDELLEYSPARHERPGPHATCSSSSSPTWRRSSSSPGMRRVRASPMVHEPPCQSPALPLPTRTAPGGTVRYAPGPPHAARPRGRTAGFAEAERSQSSAGSLSISLTGKASADGRVRSFPANLRRASSSPYRRKPASSNCAASWLRSVFWLAAMVVRRKSRSSARRSVLLTRPSFRAGLVVLRSAGCAVIRLRRPGRTRFGESGGHGESLRLGVGTFDLQGRPW